MINMNMIQVLNKGNEELFHSSIMRFLLDPKGEHGLSSAFLKKFIALTGLKNIDVETLSPELEVSSGNHRYDIVLESDETRIIIENKTKTICNDVQITKYKKKNEIVILLGLLDISFSKEIRSECPLITYSDVVKLLKKLGFPVTQPKNDFHVLINHYVRYLEKEFTLLRMLDDCYIDGQYDLNGKVIEKIEELGLNENQVRLLHYIYMEKLRQKILEQEKFKNFVWDINKNARSGVWMANYDEMPSYFSRDIKSLINKFDCALWFHIEINTGLGFRSVQDNDKVGTIQLRCSFDGDKHNLLAEFKRLFNSKMMKEYYIREKSIYGDTFYIIKYDIQKKDLVQKELLKRFLHFSNFFIG